MKKADIKVGESYVFGDDRDMGLSRYSRGARQGKKITVIEVGVVYKNWTGRSSNQKVGVLGENAKGDQIVVRSAEVRGPWSEYVEQEKVNAKARSQAADRYAVLLAERFAQAYRVDQAARAAGCKTEIYYCSHDHVEAAVEAGFEVEGDRRFSATFNFDHYRYGVVPVPMDVVIAIMEAKA